MNDAAESNCILPIGDDGSLNGGCSSSELIIIEINSESEFQQPADWNGVINQVKKLYSRLSGGLCCMLYQFLNLAGNGQFFCCGGKFSLRPEEKKRYSRLSGGCAINYDRKKKKIQSSVCWVRGSGDYDRKKKDTVICLASCAVCCISFWF